MAKREYKLDSFPPEFFKIWELALTQKLALPFETKGKAVNFKQRLYLFRRVLSKESPELSHPFFSVDLEIQNKEDKWQITHYLPEWKRAVQKIEETKPEIILPQEGDALSSSLNKLGFGTQDTSNK